MEHGVDRQVITSYSEVHPGHLERYRFAMQYVGGKILDAACGVGYGTYMLNTRGSCVGVDIEKEAIEHARKYFPGPEYRVDDVTNPQGKFDWVVSFETIEHLEDPEAALRAFRESDKLIISTPNEITYPFRPEQHKESKYPHVRHYTPDEFDYLLRRTGWKPVEKWGQPTKISEVKRVQGMFMVWLCE